MWIVPKPFRSHLLFSHLLFIFFIFCVLHTCFAQEITYLFSRFISFFFCFVLFFFREFYVYNTCICVQLQCMYYSYYSFPRIISFARQSKSTDQRDALRPSAHTYIYEPKINELLYLLMPRVTMPVCMPTQFWIHIKKIAETGLKLQEHKC